MAEPKTDRATVVRAFETEAESLVTYQLDLLAQLEAQIRAVHHSMRCIERLRSESHRRGPELSNGERAETLTTLAAEVTAIDSELHTQHQSCLDMLGAIRRMQSRLATLRKLATPAVPGARNARSGPAPPART